jgi:hypothetical protein
MIKIIVKMKDNKYLKMEGVHIFSALYCYTALYVTKKNEVTKHGLYMVHQSEKECKADTSVKLGLKKVQGLQKCRLEPPQIQPHILLHDHL